MIDRTVAQFEASFEASEFPAINAILDAAEPALLRVAAKHELREIKVERWRWDQPEIVLSWVSWGTTADLSRNIRVYVRAIGPSLYQCSVESNVWLDEPQVGNALVRHWEHYVDHTLEISEPQRMTELETRWLNERVERAYERFSPAREFFLSQAVLILPDGTSRIVDAPLRVAQGDISEEDGVAQG